jgi:hypothetical protein
VSQKTCLSASRRTAVGAVLAGLAAVSGCDLGGADDSSEPAAPSSSTPPADPDSALVSTVRTELLELEGLVASAGSGRPRLAADLAGLAALHEAHLAALPEGDESVEDRTVTGSVDQVRAQVSRRERQGQRRLAEWSVAAESGALARLLASMSAGIAAHLADAAGGPGR